MTNVPAISDDEALAALVNLIVVLADNKWYMGLHLSEWAVGAPVLESSVACAAIAQGHMGQARVLYPLLEQLPSPVPAGPPGMGNARTRRYNVVVLDEPFATWVEAVAALLLVDSALNVLLSCLTDSRYEALARRVGRMLEDERFHREFADGRVRELCGFARGPQLLAEQVDRVLPEMLCWFGPSGEPGVERLRSEGLLSRGNDGMRAAYIDRISPVLAAVGITLPEKGQDLPWERWNRLQRRVETTP